MRRQELNKFKNILKIEMSRKVLGSAIQIQDHGKKKEKLTRRIRNPIIHYCNNKKLKINAMQVKTALGRDITLFLKFIFIISHLSESRQM